MKSGPQWQLVVVLWGTKYPAADVAHLVAMVRAKAEPAPARVVLLTDRPRSDLDADIAQRGIPEFYLRPEFMGGGCQTKLCMFEQGLVPSDMPAIFIDLDTLILGNMAKLLALLEHRETVAILQSAMLPFGAVARGLYRVTRGRKYARGNSSIIVFHPGECAHVAERFRDLVSQHGMGGFRPLIADERFLSWVHQPYMRAIPRRMAVKFPTEFMLPWRWLVLLRASLPWVRRRWAGLIAVTLPGAEVKGDVLLTLSAGEVIVDRKGRRLIWTEAALGPLKMQLHDYYMALRAIRENEQ